MIEFLGDLGAWFGDPAHYRGDTSVQARMAAHILISAQSVILAGLVSTPIAMFIGHARRFEFVAVTVGNLGRALPSFGVLGLTMPFTLNLPGDLGYWPTFIALFLLAVPPILANTYVGIKGVDPDTVEAARGIGMSERGVLLRLELPLAVPLIVTGWRTASVQVVATATLGAILSLENLGRYIVDGFAQGQRVQVVAGALLLAGLAIATEVAFEIAERVLTPRTSSGKKRGSPGGRPRRGQPRRIPAPRERSPSSRRPNAPVPF